MQKNTNIVQTVVLVVFGLGILLGIVIFSGKLGTFGKKDEVLGPTGNVTIWGILPYQQVNGLLIPLEQANKGLKLRYVEKKPETLQAELVNALSSGRGPDVFMMGPGEVAQNLERLYMIPFASTPETVFKNTFADIATGFITNDGILAVPMFMDPMIMYYNKDLFASNFQVDPPKTWNDVAEMATLLTQKNDAAAINQSGVALGTANNISYPKDLIVLRTLQAGNPLIRFSAQSNKWESTILNDTAMTAALSWYTDYANARSDHYAWNASLPTDRDLFTAGKLAIYFGYPTELETIRLKNPNLNFGVAMIPQESAIARKTDYARVYTLGISKVSKNIAGAAGVVGLLTSKDTLTKFLAGTYHAPTRRDMLSDKPRDNAELALVYNSAIISKEFFDPDASETKRLITTAINQINAGTRVVEAAVAPIGSAFRDLVSELPSLEKETELE